MHAAHVSSPRDLNRLAASIVDEATSDAPKVENTRDPLTVAMERRGETESVSVQARTDCPVSGRGLLQEVENLTAAVSLHFMHYNFARPHQSLSRNVTPAMGRASRITSGRARRSPRCSIRASW